MRLRCSVWVGNTTVSESRRSWPWAHPSSGAGTSEINTWNIREGILLDYKKKILLDYKEKSHSGIDVILFWENGTKLSVNFNFVSFY